MKNLKYILILLILIGVDKGFTQAQSFDFGKEKVNLFTDRTLFIVGEHIQFTAQIQNLKNQSKALYIELILPDGTSLVAQKHSISDKKSEGDLLIPDDILSGYYYLKAYTKYMRNFGTPAFTYQAIKIINPHSSKYLSGDLNIKQDSNRIIETIKAVASQNKIHSLSLTTKELGNCVYGSISIIPAYSSLQNIVDKEARVSFEPKFFPETRSLSLSGKIVDSVSQKPLAFKEVTLSIIDQKNFMPTLSGEDGSFYFALPHITGRHDLFVSTKKENEVIARILVDQDYDVSELDLPNPEFVLNNGERKTALHLAQNLQIQNLFYTKSLEHKLDTFLIPFYGKAQNTLYIDKYISMGTLEEYFTELPGIVHIKNENKQKSFAISSTIRDMSFYKPLVLIDWVAVEDYNRILAVSPRGIEKVEIIPQPYVYGSSIYGGIISIRTYEGDFGGISLPKTGLFFNYDFIQPDTKLNTINTRSKSPDTRNTLYFEAFQIDDNSKLNIEYRKTASNSNYWLVVQGIDKEGKLIRKVFEIAD